MKKLVKMILVAIPALVVAAAVGMTTIGCGDGTTTTTAGGMAGAATHALAHPRPAGLAPPADLTPKGD